MSREIFINVTPYEKRIAILENRKIEEFYTERYDSVNIVGNIYKGRVESVLPGMGAAFVDLGLAKNGFLYVSDVVTDASSYEKVLGEAEESEADKRPQEKPLPSIATLLKKGDEVLVQVVKEPIGTKGARLTTHVSIPGRFLVLMPFESRIGISKRIEERAERDRIRKIMHEELKLPKDVGFIVRTAAKGSTQKDFFRESDNLIRLWQHIKHKASRSRPPQLIHQEYDLVLRVARDIFAGDVARLEVDGGYEFKKIYRFLKAYAPHLKPRLRFYRDRTPLFERFDIERQVEKIYNRIVQLKSGGYLVFDETESLVAIDVNSGKFVGRRNLEDTAFKTNLEAAGEVPRQLKLRDIGGIIIIDFIDMEVAAHRKAVSRTLERALEDDKAKTKILNISGIGLVEMTRQRMRRSVEGKYYQRCPYCGGRGMVKSVSTVSMELMRRLEDALAKAPRARETFVTLHPDVAAFMNAPERNMIKSLERRFRKKIRVIEDPQIHIENIKIDQG